MQNETKLKGRTMISIVLAEKLIMGALKVDRERVDKKPQGCYRSF